MNYLVGSGEVVVGLGLIVVWWLSLMFFSRRNVGKTITSTGFAVWPSIYLLWFVGAIILILSGIGVI